MGPMMTRARGRVGRTASASRPSFWRAPPPRS